MMKLKTIISNILCVFYVISMGCNISLFDNNENSDNDKRVDYYNYYIPDVDYRDLDDVKDGISLIKITMSSSDLKYLLKNSTKQGSKWKKECSVTATFGADTFTRKCDLKIHGGVSRRYNKKSFRLYFKDESIQSDEIFKDFPHKHNLSNEFSELVLNANYIDISNIRNYLSMYISSQLNAITPRIGFARLVINGKYFGLYSIIERVNPNMIKKILNHSNFDLLKSHNHDGNLKTVNDITKTQNDDPTIGFELKHGNWDSVKEFVFWLESDKYSYDILYSKLPESALFGYNLGYFYCGVSDSYSKNYYIVFDKNEDEVFLIHWDSDASFGRAWDGRQLDASTLICMPEYNGITQKIMKNPQWISGMKEEFSEAFDSYLLEQNVLKKIDNLEILLKYETLEDLDIWLDYITKDIENDHWNLRSSDPETIWIKELESIRSYIKDRRDVISDYFE